MSADKKDDRGVDDWKEGLPSYADAKTAEEIREVARAWDERAEEIRRYYGYSLPDDAQKPKESVPRKARRKVVAVIAGTFFGSLAWLVALPFNVGDEPLAGPFGAGLGPLYVLVLPVSIGVGIWVAWPRATSLRDLWRRWMD